jgi:hypothetical protein
MKLGIKYTLKILEKEIWDFDLKRFNLLNNTFIEFSKKNI